jgi:predicted alpha/beta hydrolase
MCGWETAVATVTPHSWSTALPTTGTGVWTRFVGVFDVVTFDGGVMTLQTTQMAQFDVPAVLQYITKKTGRSKISWIGHSRGTQVICFWLLQIEDD